MSSNKATVPRVILGTMTFAEPGTYSARVNDPTEVQKFLDFFKQSGYDELDTARMYGSGTTEKVLGKLQVQTKQGFKLATKVWPNGTGAFQPENLKATFKQSLDALGVNRVDILYLHAPDFSTPIEKTLEGIDALHKQNLFGEFALSNYSAWQVAEIYRICKHNNFVLPTVYQGMYNALTRDVERELFPCLRHFGIRFYAYNPLLGGIVSKSKSEDIEKGSRFDPNTTVGQRYRERYWNDVIFAALERVKTACNESDIPIVEAALRWMNHHSQLDGTKGDGIIIGASSHDHMQQNLKALKEGPLPEAIVNAFNEGWNVAMPVCPKYFRDEADLQKWAKK